MPHKATPKPCRVADLSGKQFGIFKVIEYSHSSPTKSGKNNNYFWIVRCDECGTETVMLRRHIAESKRNSSCKCDTLASAVDNTVGRGLNYLRETDVASFVEYIEQREQQRSAHYRKRA